MTQSSNVKGGGAVNILWCLSRKLRYGGLDVGVIWRSCKARARPREGRVKQDMHRRI